MTESTSPHHIVVAGFGKVGDDDRFGKGFGSFAIMAQLGGRPQPRQLVAPRRHLELQIGVMGEFGFKGSLAIIESGHAEAFLAALRPR